MIGVRPIFKESSNLELESNEFFDEGGGFSSCTSNFFAQWLRNFDSKILSLKVVSMKIARTLNLPAKLIPAKIA